MHEQAVSDFERELTTLINKYTLENDSDTPDFLLAAYLRSCLEVVSVLLRARERWYGRKGKTHLVTPPCPPAGTG